MSLARLRLSIALLALAMFGPAFAAVTEPPTQTLCNAIGSEISVPRDAAPASATKPRAPGTSSVKPARKSASQSAASSGSGGDASVSTRGRWKAFIPGTFK